MVGSRQSWTFDESSAEVPQMMGISSCSRQHAGAKSASRSEEELCEAEAGAAQSPEPSAQCPCCWVTQASWPMLED